LIPSFFSFLPIILMPLHIVFLELIIDPICSVAFEMEQEEKGIMSRPPRLINESFFGIGKIGISVLKGFVLLISVMLVYFISILKGNSESETRAIAFLTLVFGNIFLILTSLSESRSFFAVFKEKNFAVWLILILSAVFLMLIYFLPNLRLLFSFEALNFNQFLLAIVSSISLFVFFEGIKFLKKII
jgi:Ca2+-transporting ATPase